MIAADNQLYSRQRELQLLYPNTIAVVGCGGIGSWVAILAAMSGVTHLYLYDPDILEESNRNRLPFCQGSINRPKVEVVAEFIRSIRPDATVYPMQSKVNKNALKSLIDMGVSPIIDCTDSPKTQLELYNYCKGIMSERASKLYIRAGYDGTRIMVTSTVSGWIKADVEAEAYDTAPSWVVPAVTVAALAVAKMMMFFNQEVSLDISEIGIPILEKQKRITARCKQVKQVAAVDDSGFPDHAHTPEEEE